MGGYSIIIEFETEEGREAEFLSVISEHARLTLDEEPGCLRFEVLEPVEPDGTPIPNRVLVEEFYASKAALAAREANPRLAQLRSVMKPMIRSKRLVLSRLVNSGAAEEAIRPENLNAANDD